MKYVPNTRKFGNQSRSSLLFINMIFEIADLDAKLRTWAFLVSALQCTRFLLNLYLIFIEYSQQIEHANYEYNTRQCLQRSRDY